MINLLGFFSTLILYILFKTIKNKYIQKIPIIISVGIILIIILKVFNIDYETYYKSANILSFLIAPATIALAYPMYKNSDILTKNKFALYSGILIGSIVAIISTYFLAKILGMDNKIIMSLLSKSTTMPIALELTKTLDGYCELTACIVALTGVFGGVFGHKISKILKLKNDAAIGMSLGCASHVIGTAACAERKKHKQVAASTIALILTGLITSIILPLLKNYFNLH
ncbi:MAG: LrgB family protein [Candidatus Gastranaerophilales bacterium]|nr:LrgB family protein [Candidatus Gastranaerophilales bacterium]